MVTANLSKEIGAGRSLSRWRMLRAHGSSSALHAWREADEDNVGLIAAGVAFYAFLALVPLLGAIVLGYGLLADPETVLHHARILAEVMPEDAAKLVGKQLMEVVSTSSGKKGLGAVGALLLALFSARNSAQSLIVALNIAYEVKERRGFFAVYGMALGVTGGGVVVVIVALAAMAFVGTWGHWLPQMPAGLSFLGKALSYLFIGLGGAGVAATLYRYAPARRAPHEAWLSPGSTLTALGWLVLSLGFDLYISHFGHYNATYGSLGAMVAVLTWLYLSSYVLLLGAELNSELDLRARPKIEPPVPPAAPAPVVVAAVPEPKESAPEQLAELVTGQVGTQVVRKTGIVSFALAVTGLSFLRQRGKAVPGAVLVAAGGLWAWVTRAKRRKGI